MSSRLMQPPATLRGRWLLLARVAWVALIAIVIGLHVAGIPYSYAREIRNLNLGRLASEQARVFNDLGIRPEFYAAYTVALPVGTMLVYTAIFWRRSEDRMALFVAFTLVVFGGAALTSNVPQALAAPPALDRRFYRSKYNARKTLEAFSAKLRDETNLEAPNDELVGVVRATMAPSHVWVWLLPLSDTARRRESAG